MSIQEKRQEILQLKDALKLWADEEPTTLGRIYQTGMGDRDISNMDKGAAHYILAYAETYNQTYNQTYVDTE